MSTSASVAPRSRFGISTWLYLASRVLAIGSPAATTWSGATMKRASHPRSRVAVTPRRSGPRWSPRPIVWQAAQWFLKVYSPRSKVNAGTSAYDFTGFLAVCQLFSQSPMVRERNFGLSSAELRIHWPVASLPITSIGEWPSGFDGFGSEYKPSFLLICSMSDNLPVRNVQPGPTSYFAAYAFSTSGVSWSGSMVIE